MMAKYAVGMLPGTLKEALDELAADEVIREALGEHVYEWFHAAKIAEWDEYRKQVSPWELEHYLRLLTVRVRSGRSIVTRLVSAAQRLDSGSSRARGAATRSERLVAEATTLEECAEPLPEGPLVEQAQAAGPCACAAR